MVEVEEGIAQPPKPYSQRRYYSREPARAVSGTQKAARMQQQQVSGGAGAALCLLPPSSFQNLGRILGGRHAIAPTYFGLLLYRPPTSPLSYHLCEFPVLLPLSFNLHQPLTGISHFPRP